MARSRQGRIPKAAPAPPALDFAPTEAAPGEYNHHHQHDPYGQPGYPEGTETFYPNEYYYSPTDHRPFSASDSSCSSTEPEPFQVLFSE